MITALDKHRYRRRHKDYRRDNNRLNHFNELITRDRMILVIILNDKSVNDGILSYIDWFDENEINLLPIEVEKVPKTWRNCVIYFVHFRHRYFYFDYRLKPYAILFKLTFG